MDKIEESNWSPAILKTPGGGGEKEERGRLRKNCSETIGDDLTCLEQSRGAAVDRHKWGAEDALPDVYIYNALHTNYW